jgi:hypothetical protein
MSGGNNQSLLEPLELKGPAVDRDNAVKDRNDAPAAVEVSWIERLEAQHEEISAAEVAFMSELRKRQS